MYAILGDIQFDLITYFDGFESTFSADYAEHKLIEGKPRLQFIADNLDEIKIELTFHESFCDPEMELLKLKDALASHEAMALVLGNGEYKGWFVLTNVDAVSKQTTEGGTLIALDAKITLREYVGDKANPLPAPAVQSINTPFGATKIGTPPFVAGQGLGMDVRQAVGYATQAKSALSVATTSLQFAKNLCSNPVAAMNCVPGLLRQTNNALSPLSGLSPMIGNLTKQLPAVYALTQPTANALSSMQNAKSLLAGANVNNVAGCFDSVAKQYSAASKALENASPVVSKLASQIATRVI